ncbi:MAG: C4-type zinc ribbon domain-containing protein [Candidatus Binatia bacterium]|nr:C4-type zinc ribbon domain-containing protein [Candidatus Binatia bacterium]
MIDTLVNLQEIDRRNRERSIQIEDLQKTAADLEAERTAKLVEVEAIRADSDSTGVQRRELEAVLQEEERRLTERRMRLTRIRNDKELEAAQREIDGLKELSSRHEEELYTVLEQTESVEGGLKAIEEELQAIVDRAQAHADETKGLIGTLNKEIASEEAERERIAALLKPNVRRRYETVFSRRAGLAVVEMVRDICIGCNMSIPPQMANDIRKGNSLIDCPSCQRILFWRIDSDEASVG